MTTRGHLRSVKAKSESAAWNEFVENLPVAFRRCRARGHWWDAYSATHDRKAHAWFQVEVCVRCEGHRRSWLDDGGGILSRAYKMPEGFAFKGHGAGHVSERRASLRLFDMQELRASG